MPLRLFRLASLSIWVGGVAFLSLRVLGLAFSPFLIAAVACTLLDLLLKIFVVVVQ